MAQPMTRPRASHGRGNPAAAQAAEGLPPRVAQVVHALLETLAQAGGGPVAAAEVMIYDEQALTVQGTAAALTAALGLGLADGVGTGLWTATRRAREMRQALEDRVVGRPADGRKNHDQA